MVTERAHPRAQPRPASHPAQSMAAHAGFRARLRSKKSLMIRGDRRAGGNSFWRNLAQFGAIYLGRFMAG